jgi:hypothetical protein
MDPHLIAFVAGWVAMLCVAFIGFRIADILSDLMGP